MNIRAIAGAKEEQAFDELVSSSFGLPAESRYLAHFPVWQASHASDSKVFGVFSDDHLVASAGIHFSTLAGLSAPISAAMIGGVATHADWRSKGLATHVMHRCLEEAVQRGAALAFLWGSEHDFYRKFGFELAGAQARTPLSKLQLGTGIEGLQVEKGWSEEIFELQLRRRIGAMLKWDDASWVAAHQGVEWYRLVSGSRTIAFAAYGRGIDLIGLVHEWGGSVEEVKLLLGEVLREHPDSQLLVAPWEMDDFKADLSESHLEYLAMVRVLDPNRLAEAYGIQAQVTFVATADLNKWQMEIGGKSYKISPREVTKLFFGPERIFDTLPGARGIFPVRLWVWGLDAC